jgi:hypothetical protein
MRMMAAGRPLDTFVRLFLMGVPTGVREARAAMAPVPLEEWVEAGLVEADGDSVSGLVAFYLYENLILAAAENRNCSTVEPARTSSPALPTAP